MAAASGMVAVGLEVTDLVRSTAFYVEHLGFAVQQEIRLEHIDEDILVLPDSEVALVLMVHKDGTSTFHPQLLVKIVVNVADINALVSDLRSAGYPIDREPEVFPGFGLIAFSKDPDGYTVEMIQREA